MAYKTYPDTQYISDGIFYHILIISTNLNIVLYIQSISFRYFYRIYWEQNISDKKIRHLLTPKHNIARVCSSQRNNNRLSISETNHHAISLLSESNNSKRFFHTKGENRGTHNSCEIRSSQLLPFTHLNANFHKNLYRMLIGNSMFTHEFFFVRFTKFNKTTHIQ